MQVVFNQKGATSSARAGSSFGAKVGAKSFWLLSSGLYSKKVRAVIREVSCNAMDAHVSSGKRDLPIDIWLPSEGHPFFQVRDHGEGLPEDLVLGNPEKGIVSLYTTWFESDKDGKAEETGGFGLGSKSPFALSNQFTITSVYRGVKKIYSAAVSADSVPEVFKLWEGPADDEDWKSGLMVTVPVAKNLVDEFFSEIKVVFAAFSVKPTIKSCSEVTFEVPKLVAEFGPVALYSTAASQTGRPRPVARMARVDYPLDLDAVGLSSDLKAFISVLVPASNADDRVRAQHLVLNIPNGAFLPAPSREHLQYDEKTQREIGRLLREALEVLRAQALAVFSDVSRPTQAELTRLSEFMTAGFVNTFMQTGAESSVLHRVTGLPEGICQMASARWQTMPTTHPTRADEAGVQTFWYSNEGGFVVRSEVLKGTVPDGKTRAPARLRIGFKTMVADGNKADGRIRAFLGQRPCKIPGVLLFKYRETGKKLGPELLAAVRDFANSVFCDVEFTSSLAEPPKRVLDKSQAGVLNMLRKAQATWFVTAGSTWLPKDGNLADAPLADGDVCTVAKPRAGWQEIKPEVLAGFTQLAELIGGDALDLVPDVVVVANAETRKLLCGSGIAETFESRVVKLVAMAKAVLGPDPLLEPFEAVPHNKYHASVCPGWIAGRAPAWALQQPTLKYLLDEFGKTGGPLAAELVTRLTVSKDRLTLGTCALKVSKDFLSVEDSALSVAIKQGSLASATSVGTRPLDDIPGIRWWEAPNAKALVAIVQFHTVMVGSGLIQA